MGKGILLSALAGSMLIASAASATTVVAGGFTLEDKSFGSQSGIHFNGDPTGSSVSGYVNQDDSGVMFSTTTGGLTVTNGSGQATISGDPLIENLAIVFDKAWDAITFSFDGDDGDFALAVNGANLFTSGTCSICTIGSNGQNKFTISGTAISRLDFTFDPGITTARQFRVDGVSAVPEAATWAMMVLGMGLVGGTMRRRTTKVQFA